MPWPSVKILRKSIPNREPVKPVPKDDGVLKYILSITILHYITQLVLFIREIFADSEGSNAL